MTSIFSMTETALKAERKSALASIRRRQRALIKGVWFPEKTKRLIREDQNYVAVIDDELKRRAIGG